MAEPERTGTYSQRILSGPAPLLTTPKLTNKLAPNPPTTNLATAARKASDALAHMSVAEGNGQCIGRIRLRLAGQRQQNLHHVLNLRFVCPALADHGLLDLPCGIFVHGKATVGGTARGRPFLIPET